MTPMLDILPLGQLDGAEYLEKLNELGVTEPAQRGANPPAFFGPGLFRTPAWKHTSHVFGYVDPHAPQQLIPVGMVRPDKGLAGHPIKLTLDVLRIASYPGGGEHRLLFCFNAQNKVGDESEDVNYTVGLRVREGERAAAISLPIFDMLNVGDDGIRLRCTIATIRNSADDKMLEVLDSNSLRSGLQLLSSTQPALVPLSRMAIGLAKALVSRNQNALVQEFFMGLDFSGIPTRGGLAVGSYVVLQVPEIEVGLWDWSQWRIDPNSGQLTREHDTEKSIPYNYVIFSISGRP